MEKIQKNKIRYDLIPQEALFEVCKVFTQKLDKYQENAWKKGIKWSNILNNLKRHLSQFESGIDYTDEGNLQLAEVAMNALILCEYYKIYPHGDDRILNSISRPRIALDIDDVCLDFIPSFEAKIGVKLNNYWAGSYKMQEYLNNVKDDKEFWTSLPTLHLPTFEPYCYITSRSIPIEWTKENLERNGFPCAPVYSVPWNESKVPLLKEHAIDIFIDDKADNYKDAIENGIFCYLMDAPHNRYLSDIGHRRIYNLNLNI